MKKSEIQQKLADLVREVDTNNFIYDFLASFGLSKTTITRLRKGDYNLSKNEGELFYKGKVFFKSEVGEKLIHTIDELSKDDKILRHKPRFILVTDFQTVVATDTKLRTNKEFPIAELAEQVAFFLPLSGAEVYRVGTDDKPDRDAAAHLRQLYAMLVVGKPDWVAQRCQQVDFFLPLSGAEIYRVSTDDKADRDAAYKLGELYDMLVVDNPDWVAQGSQQLNIFLSRLLFCFFAEDTGIFPHKSMFTEALANNTSSDGSNVHEFLTQFFDKLNTPPGEGEFPRYLADFPYVNGGLFDQRIVCPKFTRKSRQILLSSGELDWAE